MDEERYEEALKVFREGLELIPPPLQEHAGSLWFIVAIGDAMVC